MKSAHCSPVKPFLMRTLCLVTGYIIRIFIPYAATRIER
jgi:hypothetical protein